MSHEIHIEPSRTERETVLVNLLYTRIVLHACRDAAVRALLVSALFICSYGSVLDSVSGTVLERTSRIIKNSSKFIRV